MNEERLSQAELAEFVEAKRGLMANIEAVIRGQAETVKTVIATLLAGGHALIEDMPGTGKTTLALLISRSIQPRKNSVMFKRVQFTPDLLPLDITGSSIFHQQKNEFIFHPGPVFAHIVLADELNRASPKVQSALLQCMAEGDVTVENVTYELEEPFFVIATQNPLETEGTYPLPIAQLDRFYAKVSMLRLDKELSVQILKDYRRIVSFEGVRPVMTIEDVLKFREYASRVWADESLLGLIADIIIETHGSSERIAVGASPRSSIILLKMAKAWALLNERTYVTEQDIKDLVQPCLRHRLKFNYAESEEAELRKVADRCFERFVRKA
ncbi:MAG: AAA family ATPase [Spirochaetes bacterium]|nr:AAA family ATPase [Spirochaetota bacterium]